MKQLTRLILGALALPTSLPLTAEEIGCATTTLGGK
jgi:hypothetical protein